MKGIALVVLAFLLLRSKESAAAPASATEAEKHGKITGREERRDGIKIERFEDGTRRVTSKSPQPETEFFAAPGVTDRANVIVRGTPAQVQTVITALQAPPAPGPNLGIPPFGARGFGFFVTTPDELREMFGTVDGWRFTLDVDEEKMRLLRGRHPPGSKVTINFLHPTDRNKTGVLWGTGTFDGSKVVP